MEVCVEKVPARIDRRAAAERGGDRGACWPSLGDEFDNGLSVQIVGLRFPVPQSDWISAEFARRLF
jgi:hypothetical protein